MLQKTILNEPETDRKTGRGIKSDRDTKAGRGRKARGGTKTQGRPKAVRETKAELAARIARILDVLDREYGTEYRCYLNHETPWQLLIAVIMSAQCTDARVNIVTADLFQKYDTLEKFAAADLKELEQDIHSIGFYHMKAKNIIACCQKLLTEFGGEVPSDLDALTSLAGVGRKTANVVRGNWYGIPSIVVDTHVKRVSNLLGLTKNQDPVKIEFDLMKIVPKDKWIDINTQMIAHGRKICIARRPKCAECFLFPYCTGGQALQKKKS